MTESNPWDALRQLRLGGRKPSLPVIVTTKRHLPQRLQGVGCLVIFHQPGEVMPVQLLEGLEVIFMFDRCELASRVWQLAQSRGVKFSAKTWCNCAQTLNTSPYLCESYGSMIEWAESPHAAA
jgi:hypothetical protein